MIMLKTLDMYYTMSELNRFTPSKIPAYKCKYVITNGMKNLDSINPYESEKSIDANKIKYVKVTINAKYINKIENNEYLWEKVNLKNYSYKGKTIKIRKGSYTSDLYETAGLVIPIEIFRVMLKNYYAHINLNNDMMDSLSTLFLICINPFDFNLLDENKKSLGYALPFFD